VYDEHGRPLSIADGLWIVTLGEGGLFGLVTVGLVLMLPVARLAACHGSRPWTRADWASAGAGAVILALFSIDCLLNAMVNPVYLLLAGGLIALPTQEPAPPREAGQPPTNCRVRPPRARTRLLSSRIQTRVSNQS
jgi:O-antigen ligase